MRQSSVRLQPRSCIRCVLLLLLMCLHAVHNGVTATNLGRWSPVIKLPLIPVAAANLPDGNLLLWSSAETDSFRGIGTIKATATAEIGRAHV